MIETAKAAHRTPTQAPPRQYARWIPAAVASAGLVIFVLINDVAPLDILAYLAYLAYAVLLPGVLVYRSLRRHPHSLLDDLVMGGVVGLALEIAGYVVMGSLGLLSWIAVWPAVVIAAFAAVPALRRHWRPTAYPHRVSLAWSWTIVAVIACYLAYTAAVQILRSPTVPAADGSYYLFDLQYLLSLAAEAKHHFPMQVPQYAGEPLYYHWFVSAHHASGSLISGIDLPVLYFGLDPVLLAVGGVLTLAVAAWRITGRLFVSALAAALTFAIGELALQTFSPWYGSSTTFVWTSVTTTFSWLFTFFLLMIVVDLLKPGGLPGASLGWGAWPLLAGIGLALTGAKSTGVPAIMGGVGLLFLVGLFRRRFDRKAFLAGAVLLAVYVFAIAFIYKFQSLGVSFSPLQTLEIALVYADTGSVPRNIAYYGVAVAGYVVYQLLRLAGIPVLAWLAWRKRAIWAETEWILLGAITAGLCGTLLLGHPGTSQLYFVRSIWGAGAILSAIGFVALIDRHGITAKKAASWLFATALIAAGVLIPLSFWRTDPGIAEWGPGIKVWRPVLWAALAIAGLVVAAVVLLRIEHARRGIKGGTISVAVLSIVMMAGAPALYFDTRGLGSKWNGYHEYILPTW